MKPTHLIPVIGVVALLLLAAGLTKTWRENLMVNNPQITQWSNYVYRTASNNYDIGPRPSSERLRNIYIGGSNGLYPKTIVIGTDWDGTIRIGSNSWTINELTSRLSIETPSK